MLRANRMQIALTKAQTARFINRRGEEQRRELEVAEDRPIQDAERWTPHT